MINCIGISKAKCFSRWLLAALAEELISSTHKETHFKETGPLLQVKIMSGSENTNIINLHPSAALHSQL